jgi:hypothetical protein
VYEGSPDSLLLHIKLYHPFTEERFICTSIHLM